MWPFHKLSASRHLNLDSFERPVPTDVWIWLPEMHIVLYKPTGY